MQLAIVTKLPPAAQVSVEQWKQAHCDTLSVGHSKVQSAYYHHDGHPWESSNRQEVHWGNNLMVQRTGALDDDLSIQTDKHTGTQYLKDDQDPTFNITKPLDNDLSKDGVADKPPAASEDDAASILTSAMQQFIVQKK